MSKISFIQAFPLYISAAGVADAFKNLEVFQKDFPVSHAHLQDYFYFPLWFREKDPVSPHVQLLEWEWIWSTLSALNWDRPSELELAGQEKWMQELIQKDYERECIYLNPSFQVFNSKGDGGFERGIWVFCWNFKKSMREFKKINSEEAMIFEELEENPGSSLSQLSSLFEENQLMNQKIKSLIQEGYIRIKKL